MTAVNIGKEGMRLTGYTIYPKEETPREKLIREVRERIEAKKNAPTIRIVTNKNSPNYGITVTDDED